MNTNRIATNLNGVSYLDRGPEQTKLIEVVGQISRIKHPNPNAEHPVGNFELRIEGQPDDLYLECQLWKQSLASITGIVGSFDATKGAFVDRKAPYQAEAGDVVKITGVPKYEAPLRDRAGKIIRRPSGKPVRKLTVIVNFIKQVELVARYKASIPETPVEQPAKKSKAKALPTEF